MIITKRRCIAIFTELLTGLLFAALHIDRSNLFPPPLPPDQERVLLERIRQGDTAAKDRLVKDVTGSLHQADSLNDLIRYVGHAEPSIDYEGDLFERFIDHVTIRTRTEIVFHLKCGLNLTERIGE